MNNPEHGRVMDGLEREKDHMEYTKLGNTGMDVSRICLGEVGLGTRSGGFTSGTLTEENSHR